MKFFLGLAGVLTLIGYLVLIELGINAGRVHRGVRVDGIEIGGLSLPEAVALLKDAGKDLEGEEIIPTTEGFDCRFTPQEVGWRPQAINTAQMAMRVGRDDAPFGALADRVRAYLGGIEIEWAGRPKRRKVGLLLDRCEEQAATLGVVIDRYALRAEIRRTLRSSSRSRFEIPLKE
jgi:hypothetical protein